MKQMSAGRALCSISTMTPSLVHLVAPLCLLTPVSKQLQCLNSQSLTYGVSSGPERQQCVSGSSLDSLSCLFGPLPEARFQTGTGLMFVLATKQRLCCRYWELWDSESTLFCLLHFVVLFDLLTITDTNIIFIPLLLCLV